MGSGFNSKKKDVVDMGNYAPNEREAEAYAWCIRNNIKIAPMAKSNTEWYIDIIMNNKVSRSPLTYKKVDIWKQLYKFYLYYYNKHQKIEYEIKEIQKPIVEKIIKKSNNQTNLF